MRQTSNGNQLISSKKKRKGIHAKTKHSSHKTSKHYVKLYRGQG